MDDKGVGGVEDVNFRGEVAGFGGFILFLVVIAKELLMEDSGYWTKGTKGATVGSSSAAGTAKSSWTAMTTAASASTASCACTMVVVIVSSVMRLAFALRIGERLRGILGFR